MILGRNKKILGIIGSTPIHLVKSKDKDNIVDMSKMWIDVGAKSKKELEGVISVGDPVTVDPNYSHLRNNRLTSKGLDDKVGAFIVAEVTRLISKSIKSNIGIYCVGTVQEELGLRGSKTSSFGIDPDIGIAVDVGFASDTPDIDVCEIGVVKLGEGPIIYRNADQDAPFINKIIDISKNNKIKFQLNADIHSVSGTDVASIRLTKKGIRTFSIGVPLRYMHTQVELVDLNDVESSVELISKFINHLNCN